MSALENREQLVDSLIKYLRSRSGFENFYSDIASGQRELEPEEMDVEEDLNQAVIELQELLVLFDKDTLIELILSLGMAFGNTSTSEVEARIQRLRDNFLEE